MKRWSTRDAMTEDEGLFRAEVVAPCLKRDQWSQRKRVT